MEHTQDIAFRRFAAVVVDIAIDKPLDYGIPEMWLSHAKRGSCVKVSVKGKERKGYIIEIKPEAETAKVSPLLEVKEEGALSEDLLKLALWISKYYMTPLFQVFQMMVPASVRNTSAKEQYVVSLTQSKEITRNLCKELREISHSQARVLEVMLTTKKNILLTELLDKAEVSKSPVETLQKKGILSLEKMRLFRSPLSQEEYFSTPPKSLTETQKEVLKSIQDNLEKEKFSTFLLHGVTGSGKTEIYLQAIEKALHLGKGAIMLVPEISLTVQTIERFRSRFEGYIAILHHKLSDGERFDEWERIRKNEAKIVIGARSALFSPVHNLGLILIDEEHDHAYKQSEKMPCYHARDLACVRGQITQSTVVLGSATPSLESYHNTKIGKYILLNLPNRITHNTSSIHLIDMKKEYEKVKGFTMFSELLIEGIKKRLTMGEQAILFLNRRGYHTTCLCEKCSYIFKCPSCDLALTYHFNDNTLSCHLCDFRLFPSPKTCTQCGHDETLKFKGVGTELIERSLHALFPEIRTLRIDSDTTRHKGSYENLFRQFRTGKADVLIGTQMIAKGLHFPSVTLVSILNSDSTLHIPDFRSSENVFQLITQVAGRAGRGELPGEVIIQTLMPENTTIQLALKQDYEAFFENEMKSRGIFNFPPHARFLKFLFEGEDSSLTEKKAQEFRKALISKLPNTYKIHPVLPSGHPKIKNIYRFQFLLRGAASFALQREILTLRKTSFLSPIKLTIDVDPTSTFF